MAENLYLRILGEELEWLVLDGTSGIVHIRGQGSVDEFTEATAGLSWSDDVFVMLGGEDVLLTGANVPARQRRQILQAVPYMVEEQLANDVEDCHFAIGDRRADGEVDVAVIDKTRLRSCLERLRDIGLTPRVVAVDTLLVPLESAVTVMIDGQRMLVKTGARRGFCIEKPMFSTAISLLDEQQESDLTVLVHPDEKQELQLQLSELQAEKELSPALLELEYPPFETLCRYFDKTTLNLLQGEFEVEKEPRDHGNAWRVAVILAGCAFVLHLSLVTAQAVYLDIQARQIESEAQALYREIFPEDRNVRDLRRRWQAHLAGRSDADMRSFMSLFKDTVRHLPGSDLVINNVNYNQSRGDMILQVQAARSEQLVRFSQVLSESGLDADIGTISQQQDGVNGSIRVRAGGSAS